ncbi:hypothetical protein DEFDS_P005 (plasmid) [Deferribacter desulfuricans SSM1]|uniref:Lipoprotein n=1 Tax=Deferribacter desulfuricans (strain DSM 14783 / JCM 11476 / NBRC 101012 / SSM1) TaxID=639282 RepID=D3PEJ1_DEFDS|nr:hypothetical protein [Deferribacter desulfuricans]BAI81633.1 hypothetical protein DEFDS_P005 [Deferribacter desulfuricans SSM1]
MKKSLKISNKNLSVLLFLMLFLIFGCASKSKVNLQEQNSNLIKTTSKQDKIDSALQKESSDLITSLKSLTIKYPPELLYTVVIKYNGYDYHFNIKKNKLYKLQFLDSGEFVFKMSNDIEFQKASNKYVFFKLSNDGTSLNVYTGGNRYYIMVGDAYNLKVLLSEVETVIFEIAYNGLTNNLYYQKSILNN